MKLNLKKYFALTLIIIIGLIILYLLRDYFTAIFAAIVFAFLFNSWYDKLLKKYSPTISASMIISFIIFVLFVPLLLLGGVLLNQISSFEVSSKNLNEINVKVSEATGGKIVLSEYVQSLENFLKNETSQMLVNLVKLTSSFLLFLFITFFVLFYVLTEKKFFLREFKKILPFSNKGSSYLINESGKIVKAVLIGQVLTAIIQGILGTIAFLIVGINNAFFWGIIMIVLSIIPVVGAFIVWVPAGLILIANGNIWSGVFVLAWGFLIVSQIDNIVRPKLVNKFADIHPLETLIGVFIGITQFGLVGLVLGPLIVSQFKLVINVYRKEYS